MTESANLKRSPTTPLTPSLRTLQSKKFKREEESPTRMKGTTAVFDHNASIEDIKREFIIRTKELERVKKLMEFMELERRVKPTDFR